jgi:hypothetical protein
MSLMTRTILCLVGLGIIDAIIPIPIVTLVLIYVILEKPPWFARIVKEVYGEAL